MLPTLEGGYTACFCDPPYGLSFMGKAWDHGVPSVEIWRMVYDLLVPGAVLLAFGGTRTWHRLAVAIEDAGFEVFDTLMWLYGSGFPKSHDISKAIDKAAGAEREVSGEKITPDGKPYSARTPNSMDGYNTVCAHNSMSAATKHNVWLTAPATPLAAAWSGYGTALKPAWEPIIAARRPRETTYAATAVEHGAGALWIDGCRIGTEQTVTHRAGHSGDNGIYGGDSRRFNRANPPGRWPANLLLDEDSAAMLDEQSGTSKSTVSKACGRYKAERYADREAGYWGDRTPDNTYTDSGGASRYFQTISAEQEAGQCGDESIMDESMSAGKREASNDDNLHTDGNGNGYTGQFQRDTKSTIETAMPSTMISPTLNLLVPNGTTTTINDCERITESLMALKNGDVQDVVNTGGFRNSKPEEPEPIRDIAGIAPESICESGEPITENTTTPICVPTDNPINRFFYTAKASRGERGEGNGHPTVKPLALCEYLARLIVPPADYRDDARLLVPFAGSGSEMIGALRAGWRNVTGIEWEPEYVEIAKRRLAAEQPMLVMP